MNLIPLTAALTLTLLGSALPASAQADVAHDAVPVAEEASEAGAAALYLLEETGEVFIATAETREELESWIEEGLVDDLIDAGEITEGSWKLMDIKEVSGVTAIATYSNGKGEHLTAWLGGAESRESALRALDAHAAKSGYRTRIEDASAFLICADCRVPRAGR